MDPRMFAPGGWEQFMAQQAEMPLQPWQGQAVGAAQAEQRRLQGPGFDVERLGADFPAAPRGAPPAAGGWQNPGARAPSGENEGPALPDLPVPQLPPLAVGPEPMADVMERARAHGLQWGAQPGAAPPPAPPPGLDLAGPDGVAGPFALNRPPAGPPIRQDFDGPIGPPAAPLPPPTVYNGAVPQGGEADFFLRNRGQLTGPEFERSLAGGFAPGQLNMADFMRWGLQEQGGPMNRAVPFANPGDAMTAFLAANQAGNMNLGAAGEAFRTQRQFGAGGLEEQRNRTAQQQADTQQQIATHTTSTDRVRDATLTAALARGATSDEIAAIDTQLRGLNYGGGPAPRPGAGAPGSGSHPGDLPMMGPAAGPAGPAAGPAAGPPAGGGGGRPLTVTDVHNLINNAAVASGGVPPAGPGGRATMPATPAGMDTAISNFVNSLPPDALATPEGYRQVRQLMIERFQPGNVNRWWASMRGGPTGVNANQQAAIERWGRETNRHLAPDAPDRATESRFGPNSAWHFLDQPALDVRNWPSPFRR